MFAAQASKIVAENNWQPPRTTPGSNARGCRVGLLSSAPHRKAEGRAALRLDCNRGSGNYEAAPPTGGSGSLRFGPVATTRALCPPPQLDQRVARDLGHVRTYLFKDGKLFLSLMADGGIYEWHPATPEHAR